MSDDALRIPFVVRGALIEPGAVTHQLPRWRSHVHDPRSDGRAAHVDDAARERKRGFHALTFDEILGYLVDLGKHLDLDSNEHFHEAFRASCATSNLTESVLESVYRDQVDYFFRPDVIRDAVERRIGLRYLEGWVHEPSADGRDVRVRAFGARTLHVIAGNAPGVSVVTIVRNAVTRGDAVIKTPSNDPMTAVAIARTMAEMAPDHPLTRHLSVLYWRGGSDEFERALIAKAGIEKIVVWGGGPSVTHYSGYGGPGMEIIGLDPKLSAAMIGSEALRRPDLAADAAARLAHDVGMFNQEGCVSPRVCFVDVRGVDDPVAALDAFAHQVYDAIRALTEYSSAAEVLPRFLRDHLDAAKLTGEPTVVGGRADGGVVVSADDQPVEFAADLCSRYVNLVPVSGFDDVVARLSSVVQTCGVYPDALRESLRDDLALAGVQRIVTLGGAVNLFGNQTLPQDGIEVMRRMCRWIVDEQEKGES